MSDNWVVQNLQNALNVWNEKLSEIWTLITQSPQTFKGGAIWNVVTSIHGTLQAIGYALLVLFFVIGMVKTCGCFAEVKKPEHAVKLFIRFAIAVNGLFDLHRSILIKIFGIFCCSNDSCAACRTDHQSSSDIAGKQELFKGYVIRMLDVKQVLHAQLQRTQTGLHGNTGFGFYAAIIDQTHSTAFAFYNSPAHQGITRVNPQHYHMGSLLLHCTHLCVFFTNNDFVNS